MKFVELGTVEENFGLIFDEEPELIYSFSVGFPTRVDRFQIYEKVFGWLSSATEEEVREKVVGEKPPLSLSEATLLAPIPRPIHDVICVGLNYRDHITECNRGLDFIAPEEPTYFSKRASKIYTHGETIPSLVDVDEKLDYEVELAVIIGKGGKNIPPEEVKNHIFGYAVGNDFSARTIQKATSQWSRGKGLDGLMAMSSAIVLAQDMEFPPNRKIQSFVNGELRQSSTTNDVRHDLSYLISQFSQGTTLEAGDIFLTGTPAGVAMGMDQPVYLKKGDVVRCEIDGIGVLENTIG
ncbi:MAG: fumarylacetoacetate hydrolase family protein [Eubacteriales bacterium]